jgi:hypothetical protein
VCTKVLLTALLFAIVACGGAPIEPGVAALADGRWAGFGACLTVAQTCDFTIGCGHGQFPRPMLRADGSFDVDGTYRVEAGAISINPAPPAHFSGTVSGSTLTLTIVPSSGSSLGPYQMETSTSTCPVTCLTPVVAASVASH